MKNRQIVFLTIVLLIGLGVYALFNMPRQEFPTVTIRQGLVIGAYPGANSGEVEEQLTTEVERYLFSYKEVNKKKTYSYSKDGLMIIFVELNDKVKDADEFWSKLKHGLNNFKVNLPAGVLALYADNDFGDTSALLVSLESDNKSYRELEVYLNRLEDRLRRIESVSKLRHYGLQHEQISIVLDKEKLDEYGINTSLITASLFAQGLTISDASVDYGSNEAPIHISSLYQSEKDLAGQIVYSDPYGNLLRLKDISHIIREYPEPDSYIENNAHKSLLISMEMLEGNNIVQFGEEVETILNDFKQELPEGITLNRVADQPYVVDKSVSTFMLELLFAILSVVLVTMVLLPFRVASVAASSIPITIFISLGLMYVFGIELNTVTLAALIVVLGMIVDNSIVIVDSYLEKIDHGVSRWFAAISSAKTYFKAIFSATLAISITFFPFLFTLKGTFKDFVAMFPWTVTLTLGISLMVAMMVIPYLQYFFIKQGFNQEHKIRKHFDMLDFIQRNYEKYLSKAFKRPGLTIGLGFLSILLAGALFLKVPQRLLPVAERNQFAVEIYLPQGSSLTSTQMVADSLEHMLAKDKRITSVTSFIGTSSPRFHTTYAPKIPARNYAQFIVNTVSAEETVNLLNQYAEKYGNYFPNAFVRFKQIDYQPISAPIEVRISGDSIKTLRMISDSLIPGLRQIKGVTWVRTDFGEMQPSARIDINSMEANRLGINKTTIATNLALTYTGIPVTTIWEDDYPVSVRLLSNNQTKDSLKISDTYVRSLIPGVTVPLRQIAEVRPDWTNGQVVRRNGLRTLTIMADIGRNDHVNDVFSKVREKVESYALPEGIMVDYGGSYELDAENLPNIVSGLFIAIFMIFIILLFHFKKISMSLLVLGASCLGLPGAFLGIILLRMEFGITSILGIVSLIGILVRNGIIMLDYAEELREKHGLSVKEAAIEAGKRRMRPIFLTSAAASVGVIPMIISANPLWSPMGAVICFGTLTSMIMLVLILPVGYWQLFKNEDNPVRALGKPTGSIPATAVTIMMLVAFGTFSQKAYTQEPYTLDYCKRLALENNRQLKNSNIEILASQQVKKSAFTNYFPKISASAMTYKFNNPLIELDIPGGNLPVYDGNPANLQSPSMFAYFPGISLAMIDNGTLGMLTAVQPIFTGGRIINGNNLAKLAIDVNISRQRLTTNQVLLGTEKQYWQIISLYEKKQTLKTFMQLLDSLNHEANDACNAGLINKNEVLKVALKQSEARAGMLKLQNGIKLATMAFCHHLGIAYNDSIELADTSQMFVLPDEIFVNASDALMNREEYNLIQSGLKAEKLKTRIKTGEYLPQAAVGAGALYYDITDKSKTNTMIFGTVNVPITDWWSASHEIKERKYQEDIAENNAKNNEELLFLEIQKIWNELNESWQQIEVAEETTRQSEENLKINRDNYKAGMLNISELLEAQAIVQQCNNQLTDSRSDYRLKLIEYLMVTGRYDEASR
jgi:multidrug efflux pump subunit AcrB/outer membrane protein TolC